MGRRLPHDHPGLAARLGLHRPVPRAARRAAQGRLHHEHDRGPAPPDPQGDQDPRPLPRRNVGHQAHLPGRHQVRGTLAEEPNLDIRPRRPQDPLRRPISRLTINNQSPRPHTQKIGQSPYQGYQTLGTVNAQGGDRQPLVPDGTSGHIYPGPQWSPDGTKVAFASNRDGNLEVYVVNANGTGLVNLTKNPADDSSPAWSPDGRRIAFETNRDGQDEIYVMNADGSSPGNLSAFPLDEFNPAWSPNGQTIVFERDRDGTNHDLWAISPSGGPASAHRLTTAANDSNPDWSPDATRIVYQRGDELWTMRADGSGQASLHVIGARPAW